MSFVRSSKSSKARRESPEEPETAPVVVDMTKERAENSDITLLSVYLRALLGKRCVKARLSYGDELKLHFDAPQWVENAEATKRGGWVLGVKASAWHVYFPDGLVLANTVLTGKTKGKTPSPDKMVEAVNALAGTSVVEVGVLGGSPPSRLGLALSLGFSDGSQFRVEPLPHVVPGHQKDDLPDWELFTPHRTFVRAGRGPVWSVSRSDVPLKVVGV